MEERRIKQWGANIQFDSCETVCVAISLTVKQIAYSAHCGIYLRLALNIRLWILKFAGDIYRVRNALLTGAINHPLVEQRESRRRTMDRLEEIRQRTEAGGPVRRIDMKYLLSEVDRLNAIRAEYTSDSAEITINGCQYVPKARAEAAEAERDACKADLKSMADWYRDSVCDDGICGWCKQDADHGLDGDANECAGFCKNDCFEWRGQQEADHSCVDAGERCLHPGIVAQLFPERQRARHQKK